MLLLALLLAVNWRAPAACGGGGGGGGGPRPGRDELPLLEPPALAIRRRRGRAATGTTARRPRADAVAPVRRRPSPGQPWRCSGPTPRICPCPRPTCRPRRRRAGAGRSPRNGAPPSSSPPTDDGDVDDGGGRRRRMRRWARRRRVSSRARAARRVYAPAFADGWGRGAVGQRERARGPDGGRGGASAEGVWSQEPGNARFAGVPLGYSHLRRFLCCRKGRPRATTAGSRRRLRGRGTGRRGARTHQRGGSREPPGQGHDGHAGGA